GSWRKISLGAMTPRVPSMRQLVIRALKRQVMLATIGIYLGPVRTTLSVVRIPRLARGEDTDMHGVGSDGGITAPAISLSLVISSMATLSRMARTKRAHPILGIT